MEGGVEDGDAGDLGQQFLHRLDAGNVGRIVQGRQVSYPANGRQDFIVDTYRTGEPFAAVHHPVADGAQLMQVLDHPVGRLLQGP